MLKFEWAQIGLRNPEKFLECRLLRARANSRVELGVHGKIYRNLKYGSMAGGCHSCLVVELLHINIYIQLLHTPP